MRMIPDVLLRSTSTAERKVFQRLQSLDMGDEWVCFHSLNCSEHAYKHWAEIDFLVIGPEAVLVLEVKGGRVAVTNGVWTYTDRHGATRESAEGPYQQARSAMYALQKLCESRYGFTAGTVDEIPFGFGVLFSDIDWDVDSPEMPASITADRPIVADATLLRNYLRSLAKYWRVKRGVTHKLDAPLLRRIRNRLRPDVDVYPPVANALHDALSAFRSLTEEQYERIEAIESNPRVMVSGGAGTGKTFLLVQCARRYAARGARVLVAMHSTILASYIEAMALGASVRVATVAALARGPAFAADVLLVDEGQDVMNLTDLAELGRHVSGGLDHGRWCFFLDANNQAGIAGRVEQDAAEYIRSGLTTGAPVRLPLRRNCRNTKEIVRQVVRWTGADIGETEVSGFGAVPRLVGAVDAADAAGVIEREISLLEGEHLAANSFGIIYLDETAKGALALLPRPLRQRLVPLSAATARNTEQRGILVGSAADFKGLERPIVFVVALEPPDPFSSSRLYVASTRANYDLVLIMSSDAASQLGASNADWTG